MTFQEMPAANMKQSRRKISQDTGVIAKSYRYGGKEAPNTNAPISQSPFAFLYFLFALPNTLRRHKKSVETDAICLFNNIKPTSVPGLMMIYAPRRTSLQKKK